MTVRCERCKTEVYKTEYCNYCGRTICNSCMKSSSRGNPKPNRLVICKDCWGKMQKRRSFKHKRALVMALGSSVVPSSKHRG